MGLASQRACSPRRCVVWSRRRYKPACSRMASERNEAPLLGVDEDDDAVMECDAAGESLSSAAPSVPWPIGGERPRGAAGVRSMSFTPSPFSAAVTLFRSDDELRPRRRASPDKRVPFLIHTRASSSPALSAAVDFDDTLKKGQLFSSLLGRCCSATRQLQSRQRYAALARGLGGGRHSRHAVCC